MVTFGLQPMAISSQFMLEARSILSHAGAEKLRGVKWNVSALQSLAPRPPAKGSYVGVLYLIGLLEQRQSLAGEVLGGTSVEKFSMDLAALSHDPRVSQILVVIDSPGGTVAGMKEAGDLIYEARKLKPITGIISPLAASAAYWVSSACTTLVVQPSGEVGSIGVIGGHIDESGALSKEGLKITLIRSENSPYKQEGHSAEPLTDAARSHLQSRADTIFAQFAGDVARNRGTTVANVIANYGRGRVLFAQDALRAGMVDYIGTLQDVLAKPQAYTGSRPKWSASASEKARLLQKSADILKLIAKPEKPAAKIIASPKPKPKLLQVLEGVVIPFERLGNPYPGVTEIVRHGAVNHLVDGHEDVQLLQNHDYTRPICQRSDFSLRLSVTKRGLFASADIRDTPAGLKLLDDINREGFAGWSFCILFSRSQYTEYQRAGAMFREFTQLSISEISVITGTRSPAYPLAEVPVMR